jgi:tRNA modification GTPase
VETEEKTFAAPLTAAGRGAVAVIAVRGPAAHSAVLRCFRPATPLPTSGLPLARIRYGEWVGPDASRAASEAVVVVARSRRMVEVHCHGGTAAVRAILSDLQSQGVLRGSTEEATARSGRAAMWRLVEQANTDWTAALALAQARGALRSWADDLLRDTAALAPGDAVAQITASARDLAVRITAGKHLTVPWHIVVAGPPNVGKSTLLNRLLGYRRAIAYPQPGTTRDVISAESALRGWPIQLSDTAGWREAAEPIEAEGVRRAEQQLRAADLVLLVTDVREGLTSTHWRLREATTAAALVVENKSDLLASTNAPPACETDLPRCRVSAERGDGITALSATIEAMLIPAALRLPEALPADAAPPPLPAIPLGPDQCAAIERLGAATDGPTCRDQLRALAAHSATPL